MLEEIKTRTTVQSKSLVHVLLWLCLFGLYSLSTPALDTLLSKHLW